MSDEAFPLGDMKMVYIEPFDNGNRALLVFSLVDEIVVNGRTVDKVGAVLEERQLMELVDGLATTANVRKASRLPRPVILR